ncbi:hypothetical protein [Nonomuraea glycinis]|uniref:hypothetical protein n=1 Tax=Nonomuraea glycinis TaxID=2047744 RepID=UPI002E0DECC4|nr:hypothetical protein OHA68_10950 [Nonomuraea glycinis]
MYKHVITTLTATVTGLALLTGPVSAAEDAAAGPVAAADDAAAALPCPDGGLVLQASTGSVLDVIPADELLQGLFGGVDEDGVVAEDWTSSVSLPDEDDVEAFAEGLLADVYDDPFLAAYRPEWAPDSGRIPAQTRAVGVDDLLQGVLGRTTAVCLSDTGVVSAAPWGATLISGDGAAVVSRYDRGAVPPADTTPARPQSLLDTLGGVSRIVEGIFSGLTS